MTNGRLSRAPHGRCCLPAGQARAGQGQAGSETGMFLLRLGTLIPRLPWQLDVFPTRLGNCLINCMRVTRQRRWWVVRRGEPAARPLGIARLASVPGPGPEEPPEGLLRPV